MDFGFRRLKLGSKLLLLVAIPFFLSISYSCLLPERFAGGRGPHKDRCRCSRFLVCLWSAGGTFYPKPGQRDQGGRTRFNGAGLWRSVQWLFQQRSRDAKDCQSHQQGARRSSPPNGFCRADQDWQFKCGLRSTP